MSDSATAPDATNALTAAAKDDDDTKDNGIATEPGQRTARVQVRVVQHPSAADREDGSSGEEDEVEGRDEVDDSQILEDLPDETEDVELIHSRLSSASIAKLGLPRFGGHLKRLCLRQNFISHLDPDVFGPLVALEDLDFYDNKIKHVGTAFNNMPNLTTLDLSFNLIKRIPEELETHLSSLQSIFFVQNKISHITSLSGLGATLKYLELGGNRIRKIEGLEALVNLEQLWLGKNKITTLENLDSLKKIRVLSIQSNRITKIEGLENLVNLEELYLSHNGITRLEGVEKNTKLRTLDLGNNFVERLENVSHLPSLEEFWINDNKITTLQDLEPQLKHIETLETIYLERNPVQITEGTGYRRKVILLLPQLQQLDATYVKQVAG